MLAGCTPWPECCELYRERGYWQGITLADLLARAIRRAPGKIALVHGGERISYRALGRNGRPPRVRLRRRGHPAARSRRRPAAEHSGIRLHVFRAGAHRRDSGHGAARAPPHRGRPFPARVGRRRVRDPRRHQRLRLPRDGAELAPKARRCAPCSSPANRRPASDRSVGAARDADGTRAALAARAPRPGRRRDDAAVGRNDVAVEAHPAHARRLRAQRAAVRRGRRLRREHGADGDPAARAQLQPRLARHARRVLLRRHRRARAVRRRQRSVRPGRARARDDDRRRRAAHLELARFRRARALRPVARSR